MNLLHTEIPATATSSTHAVDILAFIEAQEISSLYFETPYYLAPAPGGEKIYAMLRETLRRTKKIGIAYTVIHARQHLAALIPDGPSLVLNTLRWTSEYGSEEDLNVPSEDIEASFLMEYKLTPMEGERKPTQIDEIAIGGLLTNLPDDDEVSEEDLITVLRPRLHVPDGHAIRSTRIRHLHRNHVRLRTRLRGTGR